MNWKLLVLALILIVMLFKVSMKELDDFNEYKGHSQCGNGKIYVHGRANKKDSVSTLLSRIEWTSTYNFRNDKLQRCVIVSICTTLLLMLVFPSFEVRTVFIIWVILLSGLYASFNFYSFHSEYFPAYYIIDNVNKIRSKLKLKKRMKLPEPGPANEIPSYSDLIQTLSNSVH